MLSPSPTTDVRRLRLAAGRRLALCFLASLAFVWGCEAVPGQSAAPSALAYLPPGAALPDSVFASLVTRISEGGGFFDTDNLISNERGYLKVMGALSAAGVRGGAYVGVGPDQNFSYIAGIRPEVAFITDIRRDNLLHHLLLKALIEGAPTRVEFLSALHGKAPPEDAEAWRERSLDDVVAWVDEAPVLPEVRERIQQRIQEAVTGFGLSLDSLDLDTIRRFHRTFIDEGLDLRFTTFGRAPRPYYPTYRQLVTETDLQEQQASYLADAEDYAFLRALQLSNRVIPVVGDLSGPRALVEMGAVMREMSVSLSAIYVSNVEFYLWGAGTFGAWRENLAALPAADHAVVIRSYFPNFGGTHPSAVPGYYATQTLQPVSVLTEGGFSSYGELVTRGVLPLR